MGLVEEVVLDGEVVCVWAEGGRVWIFLGLISSFWIINC